MPMGAMEPSDAGVGAGHAGVAELRDAGEVELWGAGGENAGKSVGIEGAGAGADGASASKEGGEHARVALMAMPMATQPRKT